MRKRFYAIALVLVIIFFFIILYQIYKSDKNKEKINTFSSETTMSDFFDDETQYLSPDENSNPITLPYSSDENNDSDNETSGIVPLR